MYRRGQCDRDRTASRTERVTVEPVATFAIKVTRLIETVGLDGTVVAAAFTDALVEIDAAHTVAAIPRVTGAIEAAWVVRTARIDVTVVRAGGALVDIVAGQAVAQVARLAGT